MAAGGNRDWLENFGLVLEQSSIAWLRGDPDYSTFEGSKWLALPWLVPVAAISGAFGGVAVSAALWSQWWRVLLLPIGFFAFLAAILWLARRVAGREVAGLVGWCLFFGTGVGVFTMWAAQTESSGWAYAIAGGLVFFLLGITGAQLPPPNSKVDEEWFLTSALAAPAGGCLAVWIHRNLLPDPGTLGPAALTGGLASLVFVSVMMTLYLYSWQPGRGVVRLATLYLHNDKTARNAVRLFNSAIKSLPANAELHARRGLAIGLLGDQHDAELDWAKASELEPGGKAAEICRGWLALRRGELQRAAALFEAAIRDDRDITAMIGLGLALLRAGDVAAAVVALQRIPDDGHDALSLTYLAEAQLAAGDPNSAISTADVAIDELDSVHGRSWLVRADAHLALGDVDAAADDYNLVLRAPGEVGIEQQAIDRLQQIGRPVTDDDDDECGAV
jgi:Tfp pilus assembly protein PilF